MSQPLLRILLLGSGGRESALAWKLDQSSLVEKIYVLPGNGGTATSSKDPLSKIANISLSVENDYPYLVSIARHLSINFVIPSTNTHIVNGLESHFREAGIPCFGPTKLAAQIEGSKVFAKDFMRRHHIPTAKYRAFSTYEDAVLHMHSLKKHNNFVIKASGLGSRKGVILPSSKGDALEALQSIMVDKVFGSAGDEVIIEDRLFGYEISLLTFSDGIAFSSLSPAQGIFEKNLGPNKGGIGCYAPCISTPRALLEQIDITILAPTFDGLRCEGIPFAGILCTRLMITCEGPKVLDYKARFGDPETQTLLPLLSRDTDLAEAMRACMDSRLDQVSIQISGYKSSVTVTMASEGYPGPCITGFPITFDERKMRPGLDGTRRFFHAGTQVASDDILRTTGGRVMCVNGTSRTLAEARRIAYAGVGIVEFEGAFWRKDIAGTEEDEGLGRRNSGRSNSSSSSISSSSSSKDTSDSKGSARKDSTSSAVSSADSILLEKL
ncbi:MAG: hypothetical protein MMC33_007549 [Icmadophila ericetorum]|nr:hypothetical protein [Icmadophila ericetorum]